MKLAVARVCAVNKEYDTYGDRHLGTMIDVYAHCMAVVSSLWQELCDLVDDKFLRGKMMCPTLLVVPVSL